MKLLRRSDLFGDSAIRVSAETAFRPEAPPRHRGQYERRCRPAHARSRRDAPDLAASTRVAAVCVSIEGNVAARYLAAAGIGTAKPIAEVRFDTLVAAQQAALDGKGVMLAPLEFVQSLLAGGRLVRPFAVELPAAHGFYLVARAARFDQPNAVAFRRWLRST